MPLTAPAVPDNESGLASRLLSFLFAPSASGYRWFSGFLVLLAGGISIVLFFTGASVQRLMTSDYPVLLDSAWRMLHGYIPHRDFDAPQGISSVLFYAFGLRLAGNANAIAWGSALVAPFIGLWTWMICRYRFSPVFAFSLSMMNVLLITATRSLGHLLTHSSYAMHYNRLLWAVASIPLIVIALPRRPDEEEAKNAFGETFDAISVGLACGFLFFSKINYALCAALAPVVAMVLWRRRSKRLLLVAAGFLLSVVAIGIALHFDYAAYFQDLRMIVRSGSRGSFLEGIASRLLRVVYIGFFSLDALALLGICLLLALSATTQNRLRESLRFLAIIGFGLMICSTNAQNYDIPFFALAAIILIESVYRNRPQQHGFLAAAGLIALFVLCTISLPDVGSIGFSAFYRLKKHPEAGRIETPTMSMLAFGRDNAETDETPEEIEHGIAGPHEMTPVEHARWWNDGLSLVKKHAHQGSVIMSIDGVNVFPFFLGFPPPRHGAMFWDYGFNYTESSHPDLEQALEDCEIVMLPTRPDNAANIAHLTTLFSPLLDRDFRLVDQSTYWRIYLRKGILRNYR